jgi:hypothetical protein
MLMHKPGCQRKVEGFLNAAFLSIPSVDLDY